MHHDLFALSLQVENTYDPQGPIGELIDQIPSQSMSPLDFLIALEEELGCSIVQACAFYRNSNPR